MKPPTKISKDRKGERGAALVTAMMISFLLLLASIALILESSMNTANITDAASEEQAYYAAESGIQSVIDALRHNPRPNPLLDATKLPYPPDPQAAEENQISYLRAVRRETSNATCTLIGTTVTCTDLLDDEPNGTRLSRWLPYNWGPSGGTSKDRIVLGDPDKYSPLNGYAYSVEVSDPDNTPDTIKYVVDTAKSGIDGVADDGDSDDTTRTFWGADPATQWTKVKYAPPTTEVTVPVGTGIGEGDIGTFTMSKGTGAGTIPALNSITPAPVRFKIVLKITRPQNVGNVVIRGYISPDGATLIGGPGTPAPPDCPRADPPGVFYLFDSQNFLNFGSKQKIIVDPLGCGVEEPPGPGSNGPHETGLTGYLVNATASLPMKLEFTQPQPVRLKIKSTGYGPKGSKKQLEAIIQRNYFDGLGAPSPITLIGPPCTAVFEALPCPGGLPESDFLFDLGTSNTVFYTGKDKSLSMFQPPIGATNETNMAEILAELNGNADVQGTPADILDELPFWLQTPYNLNKAVKLWRNEADANDNYWGLGSDPPKEGPWGDYINGTGLAVVDDNLEIKGYGGGILVVNGELTINGNFNFNGIILVTGAGGIVRKGNGVGTVAGAMIVAPYDASSLTCSGDPGSDDLPPLIPQTTELTNKCFLAPMFKVFGGGNSDTMGNSQAVATGLSGLGNFVKGVIEK